MAEGVQSFRKHTRILPGFHYFVLPVMFLNVLVAIRRVWMDPTAHFAWEAVVAAALLGVAFLSRVQALSVQDRVIRLTGQASSCRARATGQRFRLRNEQPLLKPPPPRGTYN